ncbi:hypothetical protein AGMMS49592_5430 [Endomicrobiia bacterium]|nr:hypothetical protein AGMMS49592_5430 [Endomicrobiia bacterium]
MWKEISTILREKLPDANHSLWLDPIKEESFKNHILTLTVPNQYYLQRIEAEYKPQITALIKESFNEEIEIYFKVVYQDLPDVKPIIEKTKTYQEQRREITTFNKNPNFKSQEEMELFWQESEDKLKKDLSEAQIISMPGKYGTEKVATVTIFDSKFFTYPNDKRKTFKTSIRIKYANGKYTQCELYRGIRAFGMDAVGQLTTNHAKILLAITHNWQKQGCLFANTKDSAVAKLSIRDLAHDLGYKKVSGEIYKWLHSRIEELTYFPNLISLNGKKGYGFTFLSSVDAWSDKKDYNKTMLRLTFNPFISRQLYERMAIVKNPKCYRIKNPTALKFLINYDKKIFTGNKLKLTLKEATKDLQINYKITGELVKIFKRAFKELNGYEINEHYDLKVELTKENKQYFVTAERIKNKQIAVA